MLSFFLMAQVTLADIPPPSGQDYIQTEFVIENFDQHPEYTFFVGPLDERINRGSRFSQFTSKSLIFDRMDRGTKELHFAETRLVEELKDKAKVGIKPQIEQQQLLLSTLEKASQNTQNQKRIQKTKQRIKQLEKQAFTQQYHTELEGLLQPCTRQTTTRYTGDSTSGNWINTLRIDLDKASPCPLTLVSTGYKTAQKPVSSAEKQKSPSNDTAVADKTEEKTTNSNTKTNNNGCSHHSNTAAVYILFGVVPLCLRRRCPTWIPSSL